MEFENAICEQLRQQAIALPQVTEGSACVNRAFKVGKKNFLFVGEKDGQVKVMMRLFASVQAAEAMDDPRVSVGKFGWITLRFAADDPLEFDLMEPWVEESFRGFAPKALIKELDAG